MRQIRNRSFLLPRSPNAAVPDGWTGAHSTPSGFSWASGVYRAAGGGQLPDRGDRVLLLGAGDSTVTASLTLHANDYTSFYQDVAGAALASVASHLEVDFVPRDLGTGPEYTVMYLDVYDGSTTVSASRVFNTCTAGTKYTLRAALATLSASATWRITVKLGRTASIGPSSQTVPRCYVADLRARWTPYVTAPPKVVSYSDDVGANGTWSGTTPDTGFAVANVVNRRMSKPYVSASGTSAYLEVDLTASPATIDIVAICGCQFVDGDTVTVQGGAASPPTTVSYTLPVNKLHAGFVQFPPVAYRYWRVTISNASARKFVIGEVVMGLARNLQRGCAWGPSSSRSYMTKVLETPYGQRFGYNLGDRQSWRMTMDQLEACDAGDLAEIWDDCKRGTYPLLLIPVPDAYECFYGTFDDDLQEEFRSLSTRGAGSLTFVEQARAAVLS